MFNRKTWALLTGASIAAIGATGTAAAQERAVVSDEIVVTAQQREQNIQDVPIAVTALSGNSIEQAGVADIRALQTMSASINLNSTQTESGGTTLRIRGVGTTGNNAGLESAVGVFIDGVYVSRPAIALGELLDVQQVEILRGPQGTLFGRNTSAGALTVRTRAPDLGAFGAFGNMTMGAIADSDFPSLLSAQAGVNIPIVEDTLAIRISAAGRSRDGLLESTTGAEQNTRDRYTVRAQALWEPTPDMSIRLIADRSEGWDNCCDAVILRESPIVAAGGYTAPGAPANGGVAASGFEAMDNRISNGSIFRDPGHQNGFSGELNWNLGFADLTYIGAWRDAFAGSNVQDSDFVGLNVFTVGGAGSPAGLRNEGSTEYISHEVRLAGEAGRLNWLVGAYYSQEDIDGYAGLSLGADFQRNLNANLIPLFPLAGGAAALQAGLTAALTPSLGAGPAAATAAAFIANPAAIYAGGASSNGAFAQNYFRQEGTSFSLFTHNTFALTDRLDITLGARYVEEEKDGLFDQLSASNAPCVNARANPLTAATGTLGQVAVAFLCFPFATPVGLAGGPAEFNRTFSDEELVYTAALSFALTPDIRAYGSFTHGFKSGGFNLDPTAAAAGADPRFRSELVDNYELGLKTDWMDGRWRANLAIFRSEIEDFQVLEFTGVQFVTFNVASVEAQGAELEVSGALTDSLSTTFAVTYSDAAYPSDCAPATAPVQVRSLCGSPLTNAPEWVSIFGLNYDRPVGADHRVFASGSVRYESERRTSTQSHNVTNPVRTNLLPFDIQDENTKVNLRLGYGAADESWAIELWGTNIFNEQTRNVTFNVPLRGLDSINTAARGAFIEEPGIYGVTLRMRY